MQITPRIHAINIPFTVPTPSGTINRSVNVFLYCGAKVTLIDSGVAGSEQHIFQYLEQRGLQLQQIEHLILTHSHPDHIGAAMEIQRATGCRVSAHTAERSWIEDINLQEKERPVPGFQTLVGGSVSVDNLLYDGETILIDQGISLEVIHTPGHSAGSISLWCPSEKVLLTGDAVLVPGDMPIFDNYQLAVDSLVKLEAIELKWLLSAWDEPKQATEAKILFRESIDWLKKINAAVHNAASILGTENHMEICRNVVAELGLPQFAVNPLVSRSLMSCLAIHTNNKGRGITPRPGCCLN